MDDNNKSANLKSLFKNGVQIYTQSLREAFSNIIKEENKRLLLKQISAFLAKKAAILLVSYLFGSASALFDTYPFGLSLLCAANNNVFAVYLGLVVSALEKRGEATAFFLIYTGALLIRLAFSKWMSDSKGLTKSKESLVPEKLFCEPFSLRLLTLILTSTSISLARLIGDGFLYYDLFGLFASVVISPLLFCAYYVINSTKSHSKPLLQLAYLTFAFSIIYSLKLYYVLGFSACIIAAFLVTLYVSKKFGVLHGSVMGLFAGLACSLEMAPVFALIGFVFGTLSSYSLFASVIASCLTGLLFGVAADGFSAFSTLLPELALSGAIFLPLAYYNLLPKTDVFVPESVSRQKKLEEALINEEKLRDSTLQLKEMSESFETLSHTIATLSDRFKRPDILDLKEIVENSFNKYCKKCSLSGVCYGKECTKTFDVMGKLTNNLNEKGRIEIADIPGYMGEKCFNLLKIVSEANLLYSKHLEELIRLDKASVFAADYKAMSKLIFEASKINDLEYEINSELSSKIMRALKYMDIDAGGVLVYGNRRKRISAWGMSLSDVKYGAPEIREALENICETRLSLPEFEIDGETLSMTLESERKYEVTYASADNKMESSDYSGDTSRAFENKSDYFYYLISDGMGSGREAAMTSRLCAMFINKLLSAGCDKSIVIELLNNFIRNKSRECSATIDLAELDLISGKGCFVKSGAAPSYILREKNLYKLQSKTLPIGILKDTDAEVINFELEDGDVIIMFSDGVAPSLEDGVWLTGLLCFEFEDDLDKMAHKILERASKNNTKEDDMTVALIRIVARD